MTSLWCGIDFSQSNSVLEGGVNNGLTSERKKTEEREGGGQGEKGCEWPTN